MSYCCHEQSSILRQCENSFYRLTVALYLSASAVTMLPNSNTVNPRFNGLHILTDKVSGHFIFLSDRWQ
jgi:hypothetical protein